VVTAAELRSGAAVLPQTSQRHIVAASDDLRDLVQPLSPRLGLVQVRDRATWQRLAACLPQLGPAPDFRHGSLIGLVATLGTPLDGGWPLDWNAVRLHRGAGLVEARFNGGNYLPDGATYIETAYVDQLQTVLAVAIDDVWYYPQSARR